MSFSFSNFVSTRRAKTGQKVLSGLVCTEECKNSKILSASKFAPVTSVDVERTFSVYNSCLATGAIF